jgi:hypothetical protein
MILDRQTTEALAEIRQHGGWWESGAKKLSEARQRSIALGHQLSNMQGDCDRWCQRDIFLYETPEPGSTGHGPSRRIEDRPQPICLTENGEVFETPRGQDVSFQMFKQIYMIDPIIFQAWMPSVKFYNTEGQG